MNIKFDITSEGCHVNQSLLLNLTNTEVDLSLPEAIRAK